jgi:hypothetical protein
MTPTLTMIAEGRLSTADPFGRHGAMRREVPALPPRGGVASFGTARQEGCTAPTLTTFAAPRGGVASFGTARQEATP